MKSIIKTFIDTFNNSFTKVEIPVDPSDTIIQQQTNTRSQKSGLDNIGQAMNTQVGGRRKIKSNKKKQTKKKWKPRRKFTHFQIWGNNPKKVINYAERIKELEEARKKYKAIRSKNKKNKNKTKNKSAKKKKSIRKKK